MKALILLFFFNWSSQARLVESIKAQVGEEIITQRDLHNFKSQLKQKLVPPSLLLKTLYSRSQLIKKKSLRLKFMIENSLLTQLSEQSDGLIDQSVLNKALKSMQGKLSQEQFNKKLKAVGLSLESLKKGLKSSLQIDFLLSQSVFSKISLSNQDIESYHFTKYKKPLFKFFEYEFTSLSFPESKKGLVIKKRQENSFKSLEELAQELNLEYKTSRLKENQISESFKKELDKLSVSQFSSLLLIGETYYLLQLKWKSPLISPKEHKKKSQIEKILYEKKAKQELRQWLEEKKSQFFIKQNFP